MNDTPAFEAVQAAEGETILLFRTSLTYEHAHALWENTVLFLDRNRPRSLILDFAGSPTIDGSGIAFLRLLWGYCRSHQIQLQYRSIPASAEYFLRYVETEPGAAEKKPGGSLSDAVGWVGTFALGMLREQKDLIRFIGDFVMAAGNALYHFRRFRWKETVYTMQRAGSEAMPIVFLLSFLLGLVMAFQAAIQLRQFGANIFVADLLSLAFARELGPVFTAVILAGRSGSSFAAEIGTMKVNEEVDALVVMGFDTTNFLVLPKVFALAVAGPLLTILANGAGMLGGIVVGILSLDLTAAGFMEEVYSILTFTDVASGMIKSVVFAILIALIGCFRGLQAESGADSVGRQTTSAVVSGIFLIILADAIFTVLFHILGW